MISRNRTHSLHGALIGTLLSASAAFGQAGAIAQPESIMTETHPSLRRLNAGTVVFGIGIKASKVEDGLRIEGLMLNGPALKAGLKKDDVITRIDTKNARNYTLRENLEWIAHTYTYDVTLAYKKAGAGDDIVLKLDKGFVTPDRVYVEKAPPPLPVSTPPRVAYYTVVEPNTRLKIVANEKSDFTNRLRLGSCVFVHIDEKLKPGFLKISGRTAEGQRFSGVVDAVAVKPGHPNPASLACLGTLTR